MQAPCPPRPGAEPFATPLAPPALCPGQELTAAASPEAAPSTADECRLLRGTQAHGFAETLKHIRRSCPRNITQRSRQHHGSSAKMRTPGLRDCSAADRVIVATRLGALHAAVSQPGPASLALTTPAPAPAPPSGTDM